MPSSLRSAQLAQRALLNKLAQRDRRGALQAGFTLIELLIVVIIIGILAAIALPAFLGQQDRAAVNGAQDNAMNAGRACAALQVTGEHAQYVLPSDIASSAGTTAATACPASGSGATFTASNAGVTTNAVATLATTGEVKLTTCAKKGGYEPLLTKACASE